MSMTRAIIAALEAIRREHELNRPGARYRMAEIASAALSPAGQEVRHSEADHWPTCEACAKVILPGQFVHTYAEGAEVHVDCDRPYATPADPTAMFLIGDPMRLVPAVRCANIDRDGNYIAGRLCDWDKDGESVVPLMQEAARFIRSLIHPSYSSAAPSVEPAGNGREVDWLTRRIAEVVEEDGGCWRACSGCQESVDGCISARDYPYSAIFKCQPGSGCRECGGLGVIYDDGAFLAGYGEALSSPPAVEQGAMTPEEAWQELVEYDDRTSPEEHPDMALITFEELRAFMGAASGAAPRERAQVVKWLRMCSDGARRHHAEVCRREDDEILDAIVTRMNTYAFAADQIEAGVHASIAKGER
ncbi:hypothetical protein AI27_17950 [Sphingomonas sp. BHC-A]|nr:hypothetical protein AI27_17950 [Sphingomonas sp. BHC-A]